MQICDVIIGRAIDLHGIGLAGVVVEEVMGLGGPVGRYLLLQQLPTGIDVAVSGSVFGFQNPVGILCSSDALLAVTNTIQRPSAK